MRCKLETHGTRGKMILSASQVFSSHVGAEIFGKLRLLDANKIILKYVCDLPIE